MPFNRLPATVNRPGLLRMLDGLTTTFLRGDGTWASPSSTQPDIPQTKLAPTTSQTISAGYSAYVCGPYEIVTATSLEIGDGACLEIG